MADTLIQISPAPAIPRPPSPSKDAPSSSSAGKLGVPPPPPPPEDNPDYSSDSSTGSRKKWDTIETEVETQDPNVFKLEENWEFDPDSTKVIHSMDNIPWSTVVGAKCSAEGSEGVFFVELKEAGILVVKGSQTIASDLFANNLAFAMGLDEVPQMKIISYLNNKEWDPMAEALRVLENTNPGVDESLSASAAANHSSKLAKALNRPFLLIMEFIRGYDLENLLEQENGQELVRALFEKQPLIAKIGQIIAFDMLVNNWDRFPFVWKNHGNPKNIMFHPRKLEVWGIDHTVTSIDPHLFEDNCNEYLQNAADAIDRIIKNPDVESENTRRVRDFILEHAMIDIGEEGSLLIQQGIIKGVQMIASNIDESVLMKLKADVEDIIVPTMKLVELDEESVGLTRVNMDFLKMALNIFKEKASLIH